MKTEFDELMRRSVTETNHKSYITLNVLYRGELYSLYRKRVVNLTPETEIGLLFGTYTKTNTKKITQKKNTKTNIITV